MSYIYKRQGPGIWYYHTTQHPSKKVYNPSLRTTEERRAKELKREYDEEMVILRHKAGAAREPIKDITMSQLWALYKEYAPSRHRPKTISSRMWSVEKVAEYSDIKMVSAITEGDIERMTQSMLSGRLGPSSVNHAIKDIRALINWAKRGKVYSGPNPFSGVRAIRIPKRHPRWLDTKEIARVMEVAEADSRDAHWLFALGIYAGLRAGEIDHAKGSWIRSDKLHITGDEHFYLKDGEDRTTPLHAVLSTMADKYRPTGYLLKPYRMPSERRHRFAVTGVFRRVTRNAGIEGISPHTLRHTFASQLVSAGVSLYKVARWMGHSSTRTTEIYAHLEPSDDDINRF